MVDKPDPEMFRIGASAVLILSRNNERAQLPAITGGQVLAFFHEELSERRPGRVPQTCNSG